MIYSDGCLGVKFSQYSGIRVSVSAPLSGRLGNQAMVHTGSLDRAMYDTVHIQDWHKPRGRQPNEAWHKKVAQKEKRRNRKVAQSYRDCWVRHDPYLKGQVREDGLRAAQELQGQDEFVHNECSAHVVRWDEDECDYTARELHFHYMEWDYVRAKERRRVIEEYQLASNDDSVPPQFAQCEPEYLDWGDDLRAA